MVSGPISCVLEVVLYILIHLFKSTFNDFNMFDRKMLQLQYSIIMMQINYDICPSKRYMYLFASSNNLHIPVLLR